MCDSEGGELIQEVVGCVERKDKIGFISLDGGEKNFIQLNKVFSFFLSVGMKYY